jgi:alginate O-acetyltransferase complex protein AlgI
MSLGSWFRDYVYIPMGGNRVNRGRWVFNILTVWMLTGLWHGASWNLVLWGLLFAVLLLVEKLVPGIGRMPTPVRRVYVLFAVMVSFVLFNAADMDQAGRDLAGLFGAGLPLTTAESIYYLRSYGFVFLLSFVGATPLVKNLAGRIPEKVSVVLEPLILAALLLVCTGYLVDGSFNPFLYFRF